MCHPKTHLVFLVTSIGHEETRHHDTAGHGTVLRGVLAHLDAGNVARSGLGHPKQRHDVTVPCLSPSPGPQVRPQAVGALPAPMWCGVGLGTGGRGDVGDSRTGRVTVVSTLGCEGHLCPPDETQIIPGGLSPAGYLVPKSLPVLALPKFFLLLHPISWDVADGHPMMGDPLHPPFPCPSIVSSGGITCNHGSRVSLGPFFTELVPTPLEEPGQGESTPHFRC